MSTFTRTLLFLLPITISCNTFASQDLWDLYQLAQKNDPVIKTAEANYQADAEIITQSRAGLLPAVTFGASTTDNSQDITSGFGNSGKSDFNSHRWNVTLTQPLFRWDRWVAYQQADASTRQAFLEFEKEKQSLILRLATAFFNVLAAEDNYAYTLAENDAIARQLEQARQRFEVGIVAITDVHEAQARFDLSAAQMIIARNQVDSERETLREITNEYPSELASLTEAFTATTPEPGQLQDWIDLALENNLDLKVAQLAAQIAQEEVSRQKAGHMPTVDFVASHTESNNGGGQFGDSETESDALTLQLEVPLFSGGYVYSSVKEARFRHQGALQQHEAVKRTTLRQVADAYRGVMAGISEVQALEQAVKSSNSAYEATEAGFEVGTRTIVDVLNSQRDKLEAARNLSQAKYRYLVNVLTLKAAVGLLNEEDLQNINALLHQGNP